MSRPYKAERVTRELLALRDADGLIHVGATEAWARRNRNSALHAALEWDDRVAGKHWREQQIRQLIAIHVVDAEGERRLISLSIDRAAGGGYRPLDQVMGRQNLREIALQDALEDLNRTQQRFGWLKELAEVWAARDAAAAAAASRGRRKKAA